MEKHGKKKILIAPSSRQFLNLEFLVLTTLKQPTLNTTLQHIRYELGVSQPLQAFLQVIVVRQVQRRHPISSDPAIGDLSPEKDGQECICMKDGCDSGKKFYPFALFKNYFCLDINFNVKFPALQKKENTY